MPSWPSCAAATCPWCWRACAPRPTSTRPIIRRFEALYGDLAAKHQATLYPFFLDGVAGEAGMMQQDAIHPTFAGVKTIVTRILPTIKRALDG